MKILFLGGDKRSLQMIRSEENKKDREIDIVGYEDAKTILKASNKEIKDLNMSTYDVIILPVNGVKEDNSIVSEFCNKKIVLPDDIFIDTKDNVKIFTGIMTPNLNNLLNISNKEAIALMNDKEVALRNGVLTAKGIIKDISVGKEMNGFNVLIFGYGNIGKPLVDKLRYLKANPTVGVIKEEDYDYLSEMGIKVIYTTDKELMLEALKNNDTIINTAPSMILNKEYLNHIIRENEDAYILDVSSHPHGIDKEYANEIGINYKIWLGIPSVVAPSIAGDILVKKINSIIGGNKK